LSLNAMQSDMPVKLPLSDGSVSVRTVDINFKYYQRIDGSFIVPKDTLGRSVELDFTEARADQPRLNQKVDLPV